MKLVSNNKDFFNCSNFSDSFIDTFAFLFEFIKKFSTLILILLLGVYFGQLNFGCITQQNNIILKN